jgi:catechol 2,3-dioxygenase-like lactoylglutathione lyase family enzyme
MPTRFDHAVIGVSDLDAALERFRRLGFDAQPGGRHADGETHNGLIRFGLDYVELLAVYDEEVATARGRTLLDALDGREAALLGYALATAAIEEEATRFRGTDATPQQPRAMGRQRLGGQALTWRVLTPGGTSWRRPWPFLIQWDTPDDERLKIDLPGTHANGAIGWKRVAVAVHDLESAREIYRNQLGLEQVKEETGSARSARRATFVIGEGSIDVLSPEGEGQGLQVLAEHSEGPYALSFAVRDLEQTRAFLQAHQIGFVDETAGGGKLLLAPDETLGVHLSFVRESKKQEEQDR